MFIATAPKRGVSATRAPRRRVLSALVGLSALATAGRPAVAQDYPFQPIRVVVTFPPGGSTDIIARVLSGGIERRLGRPLVIENRSGAGGNIGMDVVAKAAPDGYTLGIGAAGALAVNPSLYPAMPYDPTRDLAAVAMIAEIPFVLVAYPGAPAQSMAGLLAAARARPEGLSVAHGGNGTAMHLSAELLNQMAGLRLVAVPFRGTGPSVTAVLSGSTDLGMLDLPSSLALIREGKVRALGVTSAHRLPGLPDVPTFAEAGVPGYESVGWFGLVAPARTPAPIVARLNGAFNEALREPEVTERLRTLGVEPRTGSPDAFAGFIRSETAKWAEVVRVSGAKPE
ncbi:Bug family tripartite tricarboxylate transporter substrate binding protein [Muricoccus aerilatus]|uniref:Bug family tripartite tricarboxylate transporter substrate binding protein n=1 Tax=Muricoccus aerilatus TaxID=452982 RepID=UPI001B80D836|nr:tripartite tricarboxylate transporter substrate binding protein [Roseomonas aerilata]